MFYYSESLQQYSNTPQGGGRARSDTIEQTDIDVFTCISMCSSWNLPALPDWILEKTRLQYWLEIGIASSALLSILLFVNFVDWAITGKVGLFWIVPCIHWLVVGPMVSLRWLWNFDHNRKIILQDCGLSPLWADFFGVPTARVYFQEKTLFPCYLYRLETQFKIYPSIIYLFCGIAIHKKEAFLEIVCICLCLICISCERIILMRVARYPTFLYIDIINGIETFSDCYLRCSSIVLFTFSQGDISLLLTVLPTLYMFSTVCALAIFLEQKNRKELTSEELRSLFYKSLYYAIPGTIAGYNFSVHLQHTYDRTQTVEHLKSVIL